MPVCPICYFRYVEDDKGEVLLHNELHRRYLKAIDALQYVPKGHEESEDIKKYAYPMMKAENSLFERIEGANLYIRTHFDRELRDAIANNEYLKFPTFEKYLQGTLHLYAFPEDLIEILRDMHTPIPIENI